jgi:hypothetical protein
LGVSLDDYSRSFGDLPHESNVIWNLKLADRFLGQIGFGRIGFAGSGETLAGYRWKEGHADFGFNDGGNVHIVFNFHEYRFAQDETGELKRISMKLDSTLVPAADKPTADGRKLPDYDRIRQGKLPSYPVANLIDFQNNIAYYARERILRRAIAYGEVATFLRSISANGVKINLN